MPHELPKLTDRVGSGPQPEPGREGRHGSEDETGSEADTDRHPIAGDEQDGRRYQENRGDDRREGGPPVEVDG
jgi:hypothetical protein